jgi:hypothetical protein
MKSIISIFLFTFLYHVSNHSVLAQNNEKKLRICLEVDALPYVTGGNFAAITFGTDKIRLRALATKVYMPAFITPKEFKENTIQSYAILVDYFLKNCDKGFWIGGGLVKWNGNIKEKTSNQAVDYESLLLNGSFGYHIPLSEHLYLSPWAGMSLRIGGSKNIQVMGKTFSPALLNPEASIKIGFQFF